MSVAVRESGRRSSPLYFSRCPSLNVARQGFLRGSHVGSGLLTMLVFVHCATLLAADDGEQPETADPAVRVSIRSDSIRILMPGDWGTLRLSVFNAQA